MGEIEVKCDNCECVDVISAFEPSACTRNEWPEDLYWCPHCGTETTVTEVPSDVGK